MRPSRPPNPTAPERDGSRGVVAMLVALTLLALALRWAGLDAQTPHAREADPALVHYAAWHDRPAGMAMNDAVYPSTVYPVFLGRVLSHLPGSGYPIAAASDAPLAAHLDAAAEPYLRGRRLIALLSVLAIPFTYLFARNWLEPWWAVLAAALVATSMLAFEMGVVAKPHGALLGFSALALWSMLRLLRTGRALDYALAGLATACALATLNSGCFLAPSLALAHWLGWRADRDRARWRWFALAVALCAVLFFTSYWFLFWPEEDLGRVEGAFNFGQQAIQWESWGYRGFLDMIPRAMEHDPVLVAAAGVGAAALAWSWWRPRSVGTARGVAPDEWPAAPANLVVGLFVLIFVALFGIHARYYPRFTLPLVPVLALLGAIGVRGAWRVVAARVASTSARRAIALALAALVLAFPALAVSHLARMRAREDTPRLAARWIEQHLPADGDIALDVTLTLPVFVRRSALEELPTWALQPWTRYQLEVLPRAAGERGWNLRPLFERSMFRDRRIDRAEVLDRLTALRPRWAIVAVPAPGETGQDATRATVRELAGEPVASFLPFGPGGSLDSILTREADPDFLGHMLGLERLGPPIEVYALP